ERPQRQPAKVHLVGVGQRSVRERAAPLRRGQHCRAFVGGQLRRAGQEVSVQVRVGGERHPQAPPGRGRAQGAQVAGGIHGQRPPVTQVGEVRGIPQSLVDQRNQLVTGVAHRSSRDRRPGQNALYFIPKNIGIVGPARLASLG